MVKIFLEQKYKFRLVVVLIFFSFVAVGIGMFNLSKLAKTVYKSRIDVAEINRDILLLDKILEERKEYAGEIRKVKNSLPSSYYEISFFTQQLERLAQNNNLTVKISIETKKREEKDRFNSIMYAMKINGSYSMVAEFLTKISKLPYHTSIELIKMNIEEGNLVTDVKFKLFIE